MENDIEKEVSVNMLLNDKPPVKKVLVFVILASVTSTLLFYSKWGVGFFDDMASWGQVGDFFGGILNPIIGFAGIVLIAHTLRQNQKALALTARELKASNQQLSISAEALKSQEQLMRQGSTSSALTQLLIVYRDELAKIRDNNCSIGGVSQKITAAINHERFQDVQELLTKFKYSGHTNLRFFMTLHFIVSNSPQKDMKPHLYHLIVCYISYEVIAAMYLSLTLSGKSQLPVKLISEFCLEILEMYQMGPFIEQINNYVSYAKR